MSAMYAQFYAHMPWKELPIFALLLFMGVFAAVVVRFVLFTSRAELDGLARLALAPDAPPPPASPPSQPAELSATAVASSTVERNPSP